MPVGHLGKRGAGDFGVRCFIERDCPVNAHASLFFRAAIRRQNESVVFLQLDEFLCRIGMGYNPTCEANTEGWRARRHRGRIERREALRPIAALTRRRGPAPLHQPVRRQWIQRQVDPREFPSRWGVSAPWLVCLAELRRDRLRGDGKPPHGDGHRAAGCIDRTEPSVLMNPHCKRERLCSAFKRYGCRRRIARGCIPKASGCQGEQECRYRRASGCSHETGSVVSSGSRAESAHQIDDETDQ